MAKTMGATNKGPKTSLVPRGKAAEQGDAHVTEVDLFHAMVPLSPDQFSLIDVMTNEELPAELTEAFFSHEKLRSIGVSGWVPPLKGNMVLGHVVDIQKSASSYSKTGEREVAIIEGAAYMYRGADSALWTGRKEDPPFEPSNWGLSLGTYMNGIMSATARLRECKAQWVRITYGPYLPGLMRRKVAMLQTFPDDDIRLLSLKQAMHYSPSPSA